MLADERNFEHASVCQPILAYCMRVTTAPAIRLTHCCKQQNDWRAGTKSFFAWWAAVVNFAKCNESYFYVACEISDAFLISRLRNWRHPYRRRICRSWSWAMRSSASCILARSITFWRSADRFFIWDRAKVMLAIFFPRFPVSYLRFATEMWSKLWLA